MKKWLALLVCVFMLLPIIAFAATTENDEKIILTKKQRDILQALGVEESKIDKLTGPEIGKIILEGKISNYTYLKPYLPSETELKQDSERETNKLRLALKKLEPELTIDELSDYLRSNKKGADDILQSTPEELKKINDALRENRFRKSLSIMRAPQTKNTNYTLFTDMKSYGYAYSSCYIHKNALKTAYSPNATTAHYNEIRTQIGSAKAIGEYIYDKKLTSSGQYAYNLWGDYYEETDAIGNITKRTTHQGIDFQADGKGVPGATLYNIYKGEVVNRFDEKSSDGITIVIHNDYFDVNFIYMHTQNPSCDIGDFVETCEPFAEQGYFSKAAKNTHTHFEVVPGTQIRGNPYEGEQLYSKNPYTPAIFFIP